MTSPTSCCQYCLKPIEICIQQDEKLNKPLLYMSLFNQQITIGVDKLSRRERAIKRILGLYDAKLGIYYDLPATIGYRRFLDTMLLLPICVFETEKDVLQRRLYVIDSVVYENIVMLQIDLEYRLFLYQLTL